jgi:hypothetical protein
VEKRGFFVVSLRLWKGVLRLAVREVVFAVRFSASEGAGV